MPTCYIILSRHHGMGFHTPKPTAFAAEKLSPIVDSHIASGEPLHIIHDRTAFIRSTDRSLLEFYAMISDVGCMSNFTRSDRQFQEELKVKLRTSVNPVCSITESPEARRKSLTFRS